MFESRGPRVMMFIILFDLLVAALVYVLLILDSSSKKTLEAKAG
jgi:hypothetical protein